MIYESKHGNNDFSHIVYSNFTTMVSTDIKLWFLSSLEHFLSDPLNILPKVTLFFEKIHKGFKYNGYSTPLSHVQMDIGSSWHFCIVKHLIGYIFAFLTSKSQKPLLVKMLCKHDKQKTEKYQSPYTGVFFNHGNVHSQHHFMQHHFFFVSKWLDCNQKTTKNLWSMMWHWLCNAQASIYFPSLW